MKNGSIAEKLKMQELELCAGEKKKDFVPMKEEKLNFVTEPKPTHKKEIYNEAESLVSAIGSLPPFDTHSDYDENIAEYLKQLKKKKKIKGISR
jgi:DNA-binding transcriptional regulator GbsR (MarR family)